MARYLRKVTSFAAKATQGSPRFSREGGWDSATIHDGTRSLDATEGLDEHVMDGIPTGEVTVTKPDDIVPAELLSAGKEGGEPRQPRPRGRPRLEGSEDKKPMGHRVPSGLLRELTLVAAELAYLEGRKIQQQDLVATALEEFIARQKIRIEQLRRRT